MLIKYFIFCFIFIIPACFPAGLSASDVQKKFLDKAEDLNKPKPPTDTPSGNNPDPGNPGKPGDATNPTDPGKPGNPGNPPEETPSGTKPADPGENPADPANKDKTKPEDADKDAKDKKDKTDKDSKGKKNKPGKGGKGGVSLPSAPTPPSGAALAPAGGAVAGGIIGGLFSGGKKDEKKEEKKEIPPPAPKEVKKEAPKEAVASTEAVKAAAPVQALTPVIAAEPLYSAGPGPKIAIIDFDGESGAEFSALLSVSLSADLKVYNPAELAAKEYDPAAINRISARKLAAVIDVEYIVTGKVSKKTDTLSIISVSLRDGKTGDIKMTDNQSLRSLADLKSIAENAAGKIKERIKSN